MSEKPEKPASTPDERPESHFWNSVARRQMELPFCLKCQRFYFYPRSFCPSCWSSEIEFRPVSGEGTVWSYTIVRFPLGANPGWKTRLPYVVALIDLREGVRMMSNIVGCPPEAVKCGMRVELRYEEMDGRILPLFAPSPVSVG
jgi:uncharacterized OB-fold protein